MTQNKHSLSLFSRSEEGSAMIVVGMASMTLLLSAGIAIDLGRAQTVQARLSNALDAAGLAAGGIASAGDAAITTTARKFFHANYPDNYMGSNIAVGSNEPIATFNQNTNIISLNVSGTVPTTFMKIFGVTTLPISASSQITRSNMGMELVLVLDVTGSMNCPATSSSCDTSYEHSGSKIAALRTAGADLINILYGSNATLPNMWVGMVPFTQTVKIGTAHDAWTTSAAITSPTPGWGPNGHSWYGCVEARAVNGRDVTDDPPSVELFPKYYAPCNSDTDGTGGSDNDTNAWYGTNSSSTGGNPKWGNCATSGGSGFRYSNTSLSSSFGPNDGCSLQAVTSMTATKNTVLTNIAALQAGGATEIPLGLAWGWRLLSPRWNTAGWSAEMTAANLPLPYHTPLMNKVLILMTDGNNDISWDNYTAYGTPNLTTGPLLGANACSTSNHSNCTTGEDELDDRTSALCESMKTEGIIIYTIAFGSGISSGTQTMLRECASNDDYFFLSPTTTALQTAFHQIGDSLANLRVSQ